MATLRTHYHHLLSPSAGHGDDPEMAAFMWSRFRGNDCSNVEIQRALFWLQVRGRGERGGGGGGGKGEEEGTRAGDLLWENLQTF